MKRTGRFAAIVAFAMLALSPAASAAPPQRHAVIVGINDYADPAIFSHQLSAFSHQQLPDASPSPPPARLAESRRLIAESGLSRC